MGQLPDMVIRRRLRTFLIPLALYAIAGPVSAYFVWHAINGERGLKAREAYRGDIRELVAEAGRLALEKAALERSISSFRTQAVDRDILDEQARAILGRVAPGDIVVFLPTGARR